MATNANAGRAAKRSQARRAARTPINDTPEVLDEVMSNDPEMAPQSPVAAPESPRNPMGGSRAASANLSARRLAGGLMPQSQDSRGPRQLARPDEDLTRQLGMGDLIVPKIRISQAMSKTNMLHAQTRGREGVGMGSWYHSQSNKNLGETIYFIPCDMRKSRAMFVQGQGLICRSFDLLQGEGDPGILCEGTLEERQTLPEDQRGCALRLWNRTDKGNEPPLCGQTYNYPGLVVVDIENPESSEILQGILQLRSTATGAAKTINTDTLSYSNGIWHHGIFELSVESKTNPKGIFFIPVATYHDSTEEPEYERILKRATAFARQMGNANLRSSLEADAEPI